MFTFFVLIILLKIVSWFEGKKNL